MGEQMFVLERLLLLEDNKDDAELIIREVSLGGFIPDVKIVKTRADFVANLKNFKPDLILADYKLPGYSGLEALEYVKTRYPEIPFIFVTGSLNEETAVECMKNGAWDYVLKANLIRLLPAIENALKLKSEQLKTLASANLIAKEEKRFRQIVEQLNETILIVNPQGIIYFSSPAIRFAGYRQDEIINHKIFDFCVPEDISFLKKEFKIVLTSEKITSRQCRIYTKNRQVIWIKIVTKKIVNDDGKINILVTINDITRQKKTFESLNDSEKMFRKMTENISDGLIIIEHGRIKYFNERVSQIFGDLSPDITNLDMLDFAEPEEKEHLKKIFDDEEKTGYGIRELEFWIRRKDGIRRYIHNRYSYTRENGQIITRYIITTDLTEKKISEETIRIYYNQLQSLIQAIPDIVYFKDDTGKYLLFNNAFEKLTGLPAKKILFKTDRDLLPPDLAERCYGSDQAVMQSGRVQRVEESSLTPDGRMIIFETIKVPLLDNKNKINGIVGISRDISERKQTERDLRESEELYRTLVRTLPDAVTMTDLEGNIIFISRQTLELYEYKHEEELLGKNAFDLIAPEDHNKAIEYIKKTLAEGTVQNVEYSFLKKDGTHFSGELNAAVIKNDSGDPKAFIVTVRNISDRKRAEQALRENEEKYRSLAESSKDPIYLVDEQCRFLFANSTYLTRLKLPVEQVVGKSYRHFHPSKEAQDFSKKIKKVFRTKQWLTYEHRSHLDNRYFLRTLSPVVSSIGDKTIAVTIVSKDITERKQMELALKDREECFRIAAQNASDLIWEWSLESGKLEWFGEIDALLGYEPGEFPRTIEAWEGIIHPDDHDRVITNIDRSLKMHMPYVEEYRIIRKDGKIQYWIDKGEALWDENDTVYKMLGVCSDITYRRLMENKLRESEERYRNLTENSPVGILATDKDGHIVYENPTMRKILGVPQRDTSRAMGTKLSEMPNVIAAGIDGKIRDVLAGKSINNIIFPFTSLYNKHTILTIDGLPIKDTNGQLAGGLFILQDITDRRQAEEALSESEYKYRTLFTSSRDGIVMTDLKGAITDCNLAYCEMLGYSRDELRQITFEKLTPKKWSRLNQAMVQKVLNDGYSDEFETEYIRKNGTVIPVSLRTWRSDDKMGNPTGVCSIVRDITVQKEATKNLKTVQQIYQQAIQNARGIPYLLNYATGQYDFIGQACEDVLGIPAPEVTLAKIRNLVKEAIITIPGGPSDENVARDLFKKGQLDTYNSDIKIVTASGKVTWLSDSAIPYKDEKTGKIIGSLGILQDISYRKRSETIQRVLYRIAKAALETIELPELMLLIQQALSEIIDTTNFFVALYDKDKDSLTLPYFIDEKDRFTTFPAGRTLTGQVIKTNLPLLVREREMQKMVNDDFIDLVGTLSKVWLGVPIIVQDEVFGAVVVQSYTDENAYSEDDLHVLKFVSEQIGLSIARKQTELTLRESEDRFHSIFENSPIGIVLYNANGAFLYANAEYFRILGIDREQVQNYCLFDNPGLSDDNKNLLFQSLPVHYEQAVNFDEWEIPHTRKGTIFISVSIAPLHMPKSVVNYLTQIVDITDRKKVELELLKNEKLESIGILAGGIAHDFNNILTAVIGNISLARMYAAGQEKIKDRLDEAEKASMRARELTQRLLTFSKGGLPIKKIYAIDELIEESVKFVLAGSKTKCNFQKVENLWLIEVDAGQINQVFNNIIINADQAMPEGGVIDIKVENYTAGIKNALSLAPGNYLKITIADQGIGISAEHLTKIFDPYFTTKKRGSGLGLTTTFSIIKNHGGKVDVTSKPGQGTTFMIFLPALSSMIAPSEPIAIIKEQVTGDGRILIMDDEPIVLEVVSEMVQSLGYETDCVNDGATALEQYKTALKSNKPYALVIMDLTIPGGMGGKEAIGKLLEIDPNAKAIVSSGYSNDPIMSAYEDYGFKGVVAKPIDLNVLGKVLKKVIGKH